MDRKDTVCALATPAGQGAIAVIRLSGMKAFPITQNIFRGKKGMPLDIAKVKSHTLHFGVLTDGDVLIDEVLISIFKAPHSYTAEDTVEISCHGSIYIQQQVLQLLTKNGARQAEPGEFTLRAFLNGKMDLSQAEAVADLIATQDEAIHRIALQQLRGGFSSEIKQLREALIGFAALIELELDFAEEDVEFANRDQLNVLVTTLQNKVATLLDSFSKGNVLKNGIPVVIAGKPNVGKSTLLNALLNEERAIVSEIAGTTRDVIEDELVIAGYRFRFLDTAGIRDTEDVIEKMGVARTQEQIVKASIVIYMIDGSVFHTRDYINEINAVKSQLTSAQHLIAVVNKKDLVNAEDLTLTENLLFISAKQLSGIDILKEALLSQVKLTSGTGNESLVINARHAASLDAANKELLAILSGIKNKLTTDLLASHIRQALHHLSEITGDIYTDDLLEHIFSKFCIGK
ncbi:MAG: tRNA uridine-5-carboxymethylaminomethyl(34) synthesis GTPase MnmE [Bacteroidota bacterium]